MTTTAQSVALRLAIPFFVSATLTAAPGPTPEVADLVQQLDTLYAQQRARVASRYDTGLDLVKSQVKIQLVPLAVATQAAVPGLLGTVLASMETSVIDVHSALIENKRPEAILAAAAPLSNVVNSVMPSKDAKAIGDTIRSLAEGAQALRRGDNEAFVRAAVDAVVVPKLDALSALVRPRLFEGFVSTLAGQLWSAVQNAGIAAGQLATFQQSLDDGTTFVRNVGRLNRRLSELGVVAPTEVDLLRAHEQCKLKQEVVDGDLYNVNQDRAFMRYAESEENANATAAWAKSLRTSEERLMRDRSELAACLVTAISKPTGSRKTQRP